MDQPTISKLLSKAKKAHSRARKVFLDTDDSEAMNEVDAWEMVILWLKGHQGE